jgi:penicillin-binding protein 1A
MHISMTSKNAGARREPSFDGSPAVRVDPADRPPAASRPRKRRKNTARKTARKRRRPILGRMAYWALVLALWVGIGGVGAVVWVGAHLPAIQSLDIP